MKVVSGLQALAVAAIAVSTAFAPPAAASDMKLIETKAAYADAKSELANAIINRGLVADYTGNVGGMLERTGADVGSTKKIYKSAEYMIFCSAKLSRMMMEADPTNLGFCPFVVFVYEPADKPGTSVVGYRQPVSVNGSDASKKALAEVNALLEGIIKDATK
jgi:uncharacterized protein (DUF302 family)